MYTGTLISSLMAAAERVEQKLEDQRMADDRELRAIFSMQIPIADGDQVFMGAA